MNDTESKYPELTKLKSFENEHHLLLEFMEFLDDGEVEFFNYEKKVCEFLDLDFNQIQQERKQLEKELREFARND